MGVGVGVRVEVGVGVGVGVSVGVIVGVGVSVGVIVGVGVSVDVIANVGVSIGDSCVCAALADIAPHALRSSDKVTTLRSIIDFFANICRFL